VTTGVSPPPLPYPSLEQKIKSHLVDYWVTRDVSLNEVLILKHHAPGGGDSSSSSVAPFLYYSEDADADAAARSVRPAVHCLRSPLAQFWAIEEDGTPYVAPVPVRGGV
jgi:hypothetical protein